MAAHSRHAARIETFGCRLNAFEAGVIRAHQPASLERDRIVFNTCAVTAEAERQARQAIRRTRREHPDAEIIVTGCAVQIDPARYDSMPEVDRVLGNREKLDGASWNTDAPVRAAVNDIMSMTDTVPHMVTGFDGRARAFVQIQQGCDHRCTFCTIPFGRGNNRSVPMGEIVRQTRILTANGYAEVVLTGVDIASFGSDLPGRPGLGQLVRRLLALVPELPRLRLSSLDPAAIDDNLFVLFAEERRLMPHLHLSVQAGDDLILKRMKRRHSRADVIRLARRLRMIRPDIVLGADMIAGFPTETGPMFQNSVDLVAEAELAHLHVFPYSPRPGTPAARMPQVASADRKRRAARLRAAGQSVLDPVMRGRLGKSERVLVERDGQGRTEQYIPMTIDGAPVAGSIVEAVATGVNDGRLSGRAAAVEQGKVTS